MAHPQAKMGPQDERQKYIQSADPSSDKQNYQLPVTSTCVEKQSVCSSSACGADHPVEKQNDQQTERAKEKTALSISKNIKQEPVDFKVKEEPIDLDDESNNQSHIISDDDDDDDCIIVLDVIPGDKTRKEKPKVASAVTDILIISDDEDDEKGDEPSTSTTQNQTPKETVVAEQVTDPSSSSDHVQLEQVKTLSDALPSLDKLPNEVADPVNKAVCEVVKEDKELANPNPPSPSNVHDESSILTELTEANTLSSSSTADIAHVQLEQVKTLPDAPLSLDKLPNEIVDPIDKAVCEVVKELANPNPPSPSNVHEESSVLSEANAVYSSSSDDVDAPEDAALGWTEDKDTSVPEPSKQRDLIGVQAECDVDPGPKENVDPGPEDDVDPGPEDNSEMMSDGFDSDGWEVGSDDLDKEKTNTNTGNGTDSEQIVKESDLTIRQDTVDANSETVQITPTNLVRASGQGNSLVPVGITPVDPVIPVPTSSQDNSLVPIGIIPIASEMIPESRVDTEVFDTAESVPPIGSEIDVPLEQCGVASDHKPLQDSGVSLASAGCMDDNILTREAEQTIRSSVTRSKLRSCLSNTLIKSLQENKTPSGKSVKKHTLDNPVFNCHLCFQSFDKKKLLEKHLVSHPKVTRIMCKYCNTSYQNMKGLKKHMKRCYWKRKMKKSPNKKVLSDVSRIQKEKVDPSTPEKERRKLEFTSVKKEYPKQQDIKPDIKGKICDTVLPSSRRHGQGKKDVKNQKFQVKEELNNQKTKKKNLKDENLKDSRKTKSESSVYVCPRCHGTFTSMFKAKRHMHMTHNTTSMKYRGEEIRILPKEEAIHLIFYCIKCNESFRSWFLFNSHKSTIRGKKKCEKLFQCNVCYEHFEKKVDCAMHIQEHLGSTESRKRKRGSSSSNEHHSGNKRAKISEGFKCKHCKKTFEFEYLCAKHEITHTDTDPWHCYICFKIFYLKSSITAHMDRVHKEASYCKKCFCLIASKDKRVCIDCNKRRRGSALKCSICKTEFANPSDLTCHILTHDEYGGESTVRIAQKTSVVNLDSKFQNLPHTSVKNSPPSKKKDSPVIKPSTRTYSKSLLTEKPTTDAKASATLKYDFKASQDAPKRSHKPSGSRPDFYRVTRSKGGCSKQEAPTVQTVHPLKHAHRNYDVCMKCGKQDIPPKDLSKHARTHLDVRSRFQCNACQQCFGDTYEIEEHTCVSSKKAGSSYNVSNVVYKCQFCGRDFQNMMEARKHVLSTNTSCLLECTECKAEYSRQGDLMVHMVSVHGQYLECDKCSAQFTRQVDLNYHIKQHEDMSH
nr:zinc finger protein 711-like [Lytechinus pictus]